MPRGKGSATDRGYGADWQRIRRVVLVRDAFTCRWCGAPATTVDHLHELAEGGARLALDNLAAACVSCNSRRGAATAIRRRRVELGLKRGSGWLI